MAKYRLSQDAARDSASITSYTADRYGDIQSLRYSAQIENAADLVADFPSLGRPYTTKGGRVFQRYNIGRHVLFYQVADEGILIVRILHQAMDFDRYLEG